MCSNRWLGALQSVRSRPFDSRQWVLLCFAAYWSRCLLFSRLMLIFSLSSLFVQSVWGPFCHILAGGKSVINPQRCSREDPFVVILLVMLLLSVVFNNNTIYGQEKKWTRVSCGVCGSLGAGGHFVMERFLITGLSLSITRGFIGSEVARWHCPNIIWFPQRRLHGLTLDTPFFFFFFIKAEYLIFFSFIISF